MRGMAKPRSGSLFAPLLSAVLLYLFSVGFGAFAAAVIPHLLELMERSVRLGALGWLGLLTSPVVFLGVAHRAAHGVIDRFDAAATERPSRRFASARAGMFGWFAMWFSSIASGFLLLAILPPPPDEEGGIAALVRVAADVRLEIGLHTLLWVGIAALLFHVQRD